MQPFSNINVLGGKWCKLDTTVNCTKAYHGTIVQFVCGAPGAYNSAASFLMSNDVSSMECKLQVCYALEGR